MNFIHKFLAKYNYFLQKVAQVDPAVQLRLFRIVHLLDPLTMMFSPIMLRSALGFWLSKSLIG